MQKTYCDNCEKETNDDIRVLAGLDGSAKTGTDLCKDCYFKVTEIINAYERRNHRLFIR